MESLKARFGLEHPSGNGDSPQTGSEADVGTDILTATNLSAGYGAVPVIRGLDLIVRAGEIVTLLGANGAGKTTTMKTLSGQLKPMDGSIAWRGRETTAPLHHQARRGLQFVMEGRSVIRALSVYDNLRFGECDPDQAFDLFPELIRLRRRQVRLLSGGEQQMLAVARALASRPKVLLADELSLGLAPMIVNRLLSAIRSMVDKSGMAALLVEQHVGSVLRVADRGYVLQRGRLVTQGSGADLLARLSEIEASYLAGNLGQGQKGRDQRND